MPMSPARGLWSLLKLIWADEWLRALGALATMLMFPVSMTYLAFRLARGSVELEHRYIAAGFTLALASNVLQTGAAVLDDRFSGRIDLLRTSVVTKLSYYLARVALGTLKTSVIAAAALAVGAASGYIEVTSRVVVCSLLLVLVAGSGLSGMGALVAATARTPDAGTTNLSLAAIGLALASPLYYPGAAAWPWIGPITLLSPYTHLPPQISAILTGSPMPGWNVLAMVLLASAAHVWGYRRLDWSCANR